MAEEHDLKSILIQAKTEVELLPKAITNKELWQRVNAPSRTLESGRQDRVQENQTNTES